MPSGPRYSTVARFELANNDWPNEAWSVVVEFDSLKDAFDSSSGSMRFLMENGPEELLKSGTEFSLFEGRRLVARGRIVGNLDS